MSSSDNIATYRAYLMDFGFGGLLGYGRRVSCCVDEEELKMLKDDVRRKMFPAEKRRE